MDRLDEWRVFTAVATLRSFSAAARALGRSPQSVTRAVAALEGRLRTRLLHRTTRSVSLSADGERQLENGRRVLAEFDELEAGAAGRGPLEGVLTVTAPVLFGEQYVAPVLRSFLGAQLALRARLTLLDRVVSLSEEGVDLALRIGALPDSALLARHIGQVRWVTCASPAYLKRQGEPRSPDALARHAVVAFSSATPISDRWSFPEGKRERTVSVKPRLIVNTARAAIDSASAGLGITRVLSYQAASAVAQRQLRLILTRFEPAPVPVQWVSLRGPKSRAATAFLDFATPRLAAALQRLE